jgi:hypothetical protein
VREGDHLEDTGVDGMIILKWVFKKCNGDMDWLDMPQDRDRWRALVGLKFKMRRSVQDRENGELW